MDNLDSKQKNKLVKYAGYEDDPQLALFMEVQEIGEKLEVIAEKEMPEIPKIEFPAVQKVQIEGADVITIKGEKGDSPTKDELVELIAPLIPEPIVGPKGERGEAGTMGPAGRDGVDGRDGESIIGPQGEPGKDGSPDTGEQIVAKINALPTDNDDLKIDVSHIKGLKDFQNDIAELRNRPISGGIIGRDYIKDVDLSAQLDGVTATFNIPAVWNIISVHLSSFPHALRKTVDFTYTQTTITFTGQIDPATSLAAGQTCVLTVVSA